MVRAEAPPRLVVITDGRPFPALLERLAPVLALGPRVAVQLRRPDLPVRALLDEARVLAERCAASGTPLFVNGRLDVALRVGAHLHLPASGFIPGDVRPHLAGRWLSCAVHNADEAARATGADLALVSPVFAPGSKPGDTRAALGVAGLRALAARLPCPTYALGGVTAANAGSLAGVAGAAAVSGVLDAPSPAEAATAILRSLHV